MPKTIFLINFQINIKTKEKIRIESNILLILKSKDVISLILEAEDNIEIKSQLELKKKLVTMLISENFVI